MSDFKEVPVPELESDVDIALEALGRSLDNPLTLKGDLVRSHTDSGIRLSKFSRKQLEREMAKRERLRSAKKKPKKLGRPKGKYWAMKAGRNRRQRKWYQSIGKYSRLSKIGGYERFVLSCRSAKLVPAISREEWDTWIDPVVRDLVVYEVRRYDVRKVDVGLYDIWIRSGKTVLFDGTEQRMRNSGYIY